MDHIIIAAHVVAILAICYYAVKLVNYYKLRVAKLSTETAGAVIAPVTILPADEPEYSEPVGLNFEQTISTFSKMSDRAQATFLYRLVQVLDIMQLGNIIRYAELRKTVGHPDLRPPIPKTDEYRVTEKNRENAWRRKAESEHDA